MPAKGSISRRRLLAAAVAASSFRMLAGSASFAHADSPKAYSSRVVNLVNESLVIDMLSPLSLDTKVAFQHLMTEQQILDFRASGITAFHNSMGFSGRDAYDKVLSFIAEWEGFIGRNTSAFCLVDKATDIDRAKGDKRIAVIMGIQNSDHFRTTSDVQVFYDLGQRVSQLTYNSQNLLGSGSTERVDGGLSDYGVQIVQEMNKVGMLVDVSHCGDRTTLDAIAASPVPIAVTHGNCRALNNHPRTKTDEAIGALGAKGGVMGVTGVRNFVSATEPTTISNVVDHIDHIVKLIGIDHVGIGSDSDIYGYDAMNSTEYAELKSHYKSSYAFRGKIDTDGFSGPTKMFSLTQELVRRNYSNENIRAILGGNFRRLLGDTWK